MKPWQYALGIIAAAVLGMMASNEWSERIERSRVEVAKARSITDDFVIHKLVVPNHTSKSTPIVTLTYHVTQPMNAGFGASVISEDGTIYCPNSSGKTGGMQLPAILAPVIRMPMSKLVGPCELHPGRYTVAVRFNVKIDGALKSISVQSEPFTVAE